MSHLTMTQVHGTYAPLPIKHNKHLFLLEKQLMFFKANFFSTVNSGDYIQAVIDRNLAENISRVLYPNDNVSVCLLYG